MDHIPLLALILVSVPEAFATMVMGLVLFEYNVMDKLKRVMLIAVLFSLWSYFSRPILPNIELVAITTIIIIFLLTSKILKLGLKESIFVVIFGMSITMVLQMITILVVSYIFNFSAEQVMQGPRLRIIIPWIPISLNLALAAFCYRKKISIVKLSMFFINIKGKNSTTLTLIFLMVGQIVVLASIIMNLWINSEQYKVNISLIFLCTLLGFFTIVILIISRRFLKLLEQQVLKETQDTFLDQIDSLLTTIRAQRHDFLNHVQVLHSLVMLKQYDELQNYMHGLLGEVKEISTLINIKNPIIAALLKTKIALAEQNEIELKLDTFSELADLKIKSYKLVKVLGNLLDNALEAAAKLPVGERKVVLTIRKDRNTYIFEVKNLGTVIAPHSIKEILKLGVTTKQDKEGHGIGLAVVQELVKENKGSLDIVSNEKEGTIFKISFPA